MLHLVGEETDFPEACAVPVEVAGRALVVVRWQGEVFAVRNVCPHQSQSFTPARVRDAICGADAVGEIGLGLDDPVIVCPWHTWEFRLRDGHCARDASKRIKTYPAEVRDRNVFVDVEVSAAAGRQAEVVAS